MRVQAWLGQEVDPVGAMNLESAATRANLVALVRSVLPDGFDSVHLDFEPVGDADPGYLALLGQVRPVVHAVGAILSVSAEQVEPVSGGRWAMEAALDHDSSAAVRGVRLALPDGIPTTRAFGVALYMDYFATPSDWAAYREGWVSSR